MYPACLWNWGQGRLKKLIPERDRFPLNLNIVNFSNHGLRGQTSRHLDCPGGVSLTAELTLGARSGLFALYPANRLVGRPATPTSEANRLPASGSFASASGVSVSRALVMKSVRRSSPPNMQLVPRVTGSWTWRSARPVGS